MNRRGAALRTTPEIADRAALLTRTGGPWSLYFLRLPWLLVATATVLATVLSLAFSDGPRTWGIGLGGLLVGCFFTLSTVAVAKMGEISDRLTLPTALVVYGLKLGALGVILMAVPVGGPVDRKALGLTVVAAAALWLGAQIWSVVRTPMLYVDSEAAARPNVPGRR